MVLGHDLSAYAFEKNEKQEVNLACCKDRRFRMDGSNFVLHLYLMAWALFLWAGAHLANECLLRRSCWQ